MGALDGVRVIDLTRILGGPFCTQWLGDHGAEVIKVEPPQGDDVRHWGPPFDEEVGAASYFLGINRNKRGMALDLRSASGQEAFLKLLATADVLIENFKPGSMEKWGLGYDDVLLKKFPRLIHAKVSGFGADGPMGGLPGYDAVIQAQAGLMSVNGVPGGGPTRLGIPIVDIATGMATAIGINMALYEREKSGRGQFIEASLYDTGVSLLFPHYANYFLSGKTPQITGNRHTNLSPYDAYPTKTCDIFIAGGNEGQFKRLCTVLGVPELAEDATFSSNAGRITNQEALRARFEPLMAQWDGEELASTLMKNGVPAGPVLEIPAVMEAEHTMVREMTININGFRTTGNPIKMSRTPAQPAKKKPPKFGEETRTILAEIGYSAEEIDAMIAAGCALDGTKT
ncbi:MAG: CaiB/BaiF CoA-transferase family protein [Pseudomonadota bacterium]